MDDKEKGQVSEEMYAPSVRHSMSSKDDNHAEPPVANTLHRGLKPRHSSMIAIGGGMGTGLIIGTASSLKNAGPVSLLLGFIVMGWAFWVVMCAIGEMASFRPDSRGFAGYASRYVDPAFGFAMGYNYVFKYLVVIANNLNALALIISYWDDSTSPAVFITVFSAAILAINLLNVRHFGEIEFWLSAVKLTVIFGLIILNIVICLGGAPTHDRLGFRYWKNGLAFREYEAKGSLGRFLGFWSTLTTALFAYVGSELVCVTVAETSSPRQSVKKAVKQTMFRIIVCYIGGVLTLGLVIPANSPALLSATKSSVSAAASPFVAAIRLAQIPVLPAIVNACLMVFAFSSANSDQYISSRTLRSLAMEGQAPKWLMGGHTKSGIPIRTIAVTFPFVALAYINLASNGAQAFTYLSSTVSILGGIMWWGMLLTHIRFMAAMKAQGIDRSSLPYCSPFQPYLSYAAFFLVTLVLLFKGFTVFIGGFDWRLFITTYIGIPVFAIMYVGWKVVHKTKIVNAHEADLQLVEVSDLD